MGKVTEFISKVRGQLLVSSLGVLALLMVFTVSTSGSYASSTATGASISAQVDGQDIPEARPTGIVPRFVRICHRTGSPQRPFREIVIPRPALPHHLQHGDIYPVPPGGCPASPPPIPTGVQTHVPPPIPTRTHRPPHPTRTHPPHPTHVPTHGPGSDK